MTDSASSNLNRFFPMGLLWCLLVGLVLGFLRYWMGFFVIAQGACIGLLVPWLARRSQGGEGPVHPGPGASLLVALAWWGAAQAGLMIGFGLAQPWFDPLGWLGRIMDGHTAEFVFGVATNTGFARGVALGAQGGFWLVLNLIDTAIMFFFLWIMPWSRKSQTRTPGTGPEAAS